MKDVLRIANAHAFWGDDLGAAARLVEQCPGLDWITLDFLAEVSMSILAKQREREPSAGYATDFLDVVQSLLPAWKSGRRVRLVTNAGGLNPRGCAEACAKLLRDAGVRGRKIGIVWGDDVLPILGEGKYPFRHLENGAPLESVAGRLVAASAYLGAAPVADAISRGADLIITGRVADPSLTVGPALAHFGWQAGDCDRIAGATVAGHLIECGTQVTGGISTDWLNIPDPAKIGFPIAEIELDGSCTITKPPRTGGRVNELVVKEQLLYEIGDPANYLSPDATVSFLSLRVHEGGRDRVRVTGATGRPPTDSYKVSAVYRAGFRATGTLTIIGRDAAAKARRCGEIVLKRVANSGLALERSMVECLGASDRAREVVLRISVADRRRDLVEHFTKEIMPLITAGPQGTTGYAEGRPAVREVFGYWPTLIPRSLVHPQVEMLEV